MSLTSAMSVLIERGNEARRNEEIASRGSGRLEAGDAAAGHGREVGEDGRIADGILLSL
jgi:hypothetical protein